MPNPADTAARDQLDMAFRDACQRARDNLADFTDHPMPERQVGTPEELAGPGRAMWQRLADWFLAEPVECAHLPFTGTVPVFWYPHHPAILCHVCAGRLLDQLDPAEEWRCDFCRSDSREMAVSTMVIDGFTIDGHVHPPINIVYGCCPACAEKLS